MAPGRVALVGGSAGTNVHRSGRRQPFQWRRMPRQPYRPDRRMGQEGRGDLGWHRNMKDMGRDRDDAIDGVESPRRTMTGGKEDGYDSLNRSILRLIASEGVIDRANKFGEVAKVGAGPNYSSDDDRDVSGELNGPRWSSCVDRWQQRWFHRDVCTRYSSVLESPIHHFKW